MTPMERILDALRATGRTVKAGEEWWRTTCPAHDDTHASLGIKEDPATGKAVVKCFAGCPNERVLAALGLEVKDLFPAPAPSDADRSSGSGERPLTVQTLAEAKGLPTRFLVEQGVSAFKGGVVIQYRRRDGSPARSRLRLALDGENRFRWGYAKTRGGDKLPMVPYGLWRLCQVGDGSPLLVVEGESDCWAAWLHGLPALGLPGADTARLLEGEHLQGVPRLCVVKEPDQGGETFVQGIADRLKAIGWEGEAQFTSLQDTCGAEDLADLHAALEGDGGRFRQAVEKAVGAARPLPTPAVTAAKDRWDDLQPLEVEEDPPAIHLDACFGPVPELRDYVAAVAESYQVDPAMPAMLSLSCLSLGISRAIEIRLGPDWLQTAPVWTCTIAEPGERKSAVFAELTAPIFTYQKHHDDEIQDVVARHAAETRSLQKRIDTLRGRHARGGDASELRELLDLEADLARRETLEKPRLVLMDATPESVIVALHRNGEKLGIISAESSALENALGRYSDNPNLDIYLQGHEGDPYVYTRRKGDDITLERPTLTMSLTVQPHAARGLLDHDAAIGRGMFARFLYARPHSLKGHRTLQPPPVPEALRRWWADRLIGLLSLPYPGEVCDVGGVAVRREGEPRILGLEPEAAEMFLAFRGEIERELATEDGELAHTCGWAEKFAAATGRIALSLQMAATPGARAVTPEVMGAAIAWAEFLIPAFRHVVTTVGLEPIQEQARRIVGWIRRKDLEAFSHREACRRHRCKAFKTNEDWEPVFGLLVRRNYLRETKVPPKGGQGGRPSVEYLVNPALLRERTPITPRAAG